MLVSIVTPSFNQGQYIAATIDSVLAQGYPHIEYIVVDGASSDCTLEILRRYEDRICWISEHDDGQAAAINKGWRMARGEIVAWLNSDDVYWPGAVCAAVDAFHQHPEAGVIFGDCMYIAKDGAPLEAYKTYAFDYMQFVRSARSPIPQPSAFIRRAVLDAAGYLDETFQLALDYEFWLRAGLYYPVEYVPHTLSGYRVHATSKSATQSAACGAETVRAFHKLFARSDLSPAIRGLERTAMANVLLWAAQDAFSDADLVMARQRLLEGWRRRPLYLRRFMIKILIVSLLGRTAWSAWMRFRRWRGAELGVFEKNLSV
jgi:GT2 family glycosyltransferase